VNHRRKLTRSPHPIGSGKHEMRCINEQFRPIARCAPCGVAQRWWPARRGSACAIGSRASWPAGDCWAERSACSRWDSIGRQVFPGRTSGPSLNRYLPPTVPDRPRAEPNRACPRSPGSAVGITERMWIARSP